MCVRWKYYCCFVRRNQKYSYSNSSDMKPVWCAASHAYYYNGHFMCIQMYTIRFRKWARIDMCEWAILLCIGVHRQLDEKPNERKNDRKRVCLCLVVRSCAIERSNKIQNPDTRNTFMVDQDLLCTLQAAHYQPKMIWNIRGKKNGRTASRQWTSFTLHCCLLFSFIFFSSLICFLLAQFIRAFIFCCASSCIHMLFVVLNGPFASECLSALYWWAVIMNWLNSLWVCVFVWSHSFDGMLSCAGRVRQFEWRELQIMHCKVFCRHNCLVSQMRKCACHWSKMQIDF